jgi:hypothetical protein
MGKPGSNSVDIFTYCAYRPDCLSMLLDCCTERLIAKDRVSFFGIRMNTCTVEEPCSGVFGLYDKCILAVQRGAVGGRQIM